ncbi:helix-turn-helix domain-containing protein [Acuticoccus sediminis]|uniref:hypothetical protein n=1 Tax=Acuticoccus sediminis TaxID=2184697 RepID=UPI001CFF1E37|nr:hypothetical protein [Acuticoccus sediminis]
MSETTLRRYDSAEVLKSEEAITVYLDEALDDADLTRSMWGRLREGAICHVKAGLARLIALRER